MSKRILELSEEDLGLALREYIAKHHAEMWKPGKLEVVFWRNHTATLTVSWRLETSGAAKEPQL